MGMESYLFKVVFKEKVRNEEIVPLLIKTGARMLEEEKSFWDDSFGYKSFFFEIRSDQGLTQMHVLLDGNETYLENFSVRFSVVSPATVIDQTFDFFERLNSQTPIVLRDAEIVNHLWRRDVKAGKRDNSYEAMRVENEADENYEKSALIPIDAVLFKANEMGIAKRKIVLENEIGAIVGGGGDTFRYLDSTQTNIEQKMIKIIENEL